MMHYFKIASAVLQGDKQAFAKEATSALYDHFSNKISKNPQGLPGMLSGLASAFPGGKEIVDSWIGTGENKPISGEQVQKAMPDMINSVAKAFGASDKDIAMVNNFVASFLPGLIDSLTPGGDVPTDPKEAQRRLNSLRSQMA